jgi:hypothetical protein
MVQYEDHLAVAPVLPAVGPVPEGGEAASEAAAMNEVMREQVAVATGVQQEYRAMTQASSGTAGEIRRRIEIGAPRMASYRAALFAALLSGRFMAAFPPLVDPWRMPSFSMRTHKKRRNQTESYHRRIQKKWDKRYGVIGNALFGEFGRHGY